MVGANSNVLICRVSGDDSVVATAKSVLSREGYTVNETSNGATNLSWPDVVVVVITKSAAGTGWLKGVLTSAGAAGKRVVGIWAPGAEISDLPGELATFARAIVCPRAEEIRSAVGGVDISQDADCKEIPVKDFPRVKCQ